ncbi:MAG: molybdopterin molybdotransferase MoeA [Bacteroidetes bacterium]|nr:molybdopterin molybdotransferase MoeA [Bacteroidota bacterium]
MIDYRQAQQIVLAQARSFGHEELPLEMAFGRVLAEPVFADRDYPPFPRATMDGYALRSADLEMGLFTFSIAETIYAGDTPTRDVGEGECYKIMTGAAVPASADVIVRREDVREDEGKAVLSDILAQPFQNIARQGEDLRMGDVVIGRSCRCEPAVMGLLATLGRAAVKVEKLPRVTLLTTGNEVVQVGEAVSPVQIRNSNRWLLEAALKKEGVALHRWAHVADDPGLLRREIGAALGSDMVILCGGVSAGDADYVPEVLAQLGVEKLFHKMAIRPGKPTWCGVAKGGAMVFALPGNPFSCLVNTILLIRPYLQACWGLPVQAPLGLPMGEARKKKTPLDEFFPVHLSGAPARVVGVSLNGSGDIRLGRQANGLALHAADSGDLSAGDVVLCYSFV